MTTFNNRIAGGLNPHCPTARQDLNVLALVKGDERYVFLYHDSHRESVMRTLGRFAANPELSFTWYDAAVLSQKIRDTSQSRDLI